VDPWLKALKMRAVWDTDCERRARRIQRGGNADDDDDGVMNAAQHREMVMFGIEEPEAEAQPTIHDEALSFLELKRARRKSSLRAGQLQPEVMPREWPGRSAIDFWREVGTVKYPRLAPMVMDFLSLGCTSVESERYFRGLKQYYPPESRRLNVVTLGSKMVLHMNMQAEIERRYGSDCGLKTPRTLRLEQLKRLRRYPGGEDGSRVADRARKAAWGPSPGRKASDPR
jgi:hypothetical protein